MLSVENPFVLKLHLRHPSSSLNPKLKKIREEKNKIWLNEREKSSDRKKCECQPKCSLHFFRLFKTTATASCHQHQTSWWRKKKNKTHTFFVVVVQKSVNKWLTRCRRKKKKEENSKARALPINHHLAFSYMLHHVQHACSNRLVLLF